MLITFVLLFGINVKVLSCCSNLVLLLLLLLCIDFDVFDFFRLNFINLLRKFFFLSILLVLLLFKLLDVE